MPGGLEENGKKSFSVEVLMVKVKNGQIIHDNMHAGDSFLPYSIPNLSI
jgi:hypothetical protein